MTKAVYLVGPPASGKSTTMRALYDLLGVETGEPFTIWPGHHGIFKGEPLLSILDGSSLGLSLGVNREGGFPGTDGLSMAAPPVAVEWLQEAEELPPLILGEGNRLSTDGFVIELALRTDLVLAHLSVPEAVLDRRCEERGSKQDRKWRKSAATRATRAARAAGGAGARVRFYNTDVHSPHEVARAILKDLENIS